MWGGASFYGVNPSQGGGPRLPPPSVT